MKNGRFDVEYIGPLERDRKILQGAFVTFLKALVESLTKPSKEKDMSEDKTTISEKTVTVEPAQPTPPIPTPKPAPQPPPTLPPVVPAT